MVAMGRSHLLREKFFDFSQQKRTKNKFIPLRMHLRMCFLPMIAPPFKILDPPLPVLSTIMIGSDPNPNRFETESFNLIQT
jgi:hypothetical protein